MYMDSYQDACFQYSKYPPAYEPFLLALGLAGEAGEVAEKIKKFYRDDLPYEESREAIKKELGDTLWYLGQVARNWGFALSEVAKGNLAKLEDRRARGVISGQGDNR